MKSNSVIKAILITFVAALVDLRQRGSRGKPH